MTEDMQAIVFDTFGAPNVLKVVRYPKPVPRTGEVLVKIHAAGVNPVDFKVRKGDMMRFLVSRPRIPGGDLSGTIEEVDEKSKWKPGQKVFALVPGFSPHHKDGAYAGTHSLPGIGGGWGEGGAAGADPRRRWRCGHICCAAGQSTGRACDHHCRAAQPRLCHQGAERR
ncbi:hypothetical protein WJX75_009967 [Coccomyxa subellipsoidea]|uniref:Alcohol dehydrogenase-like N-terminal domain-containing protein n=1 Tax=Coccomyxa subellipsoidea TaxID=248742 RepID=A0ABR2YKC4_9CHLO